MNPTLAQVEGVRQLIATLLPGTYPVVGGGCLRDIHHNRPVKDIDIFISTDQLASSFIHHNDNFLQVPAPPFIQQYGRPDMHGAWDVLYAHGFQWPIQVILADFSTPEELAGSFDLGIARIVLSSQGLYCHPDFIEDSARRVFRIRRGDSPMEIARSLKRIKRLQESKYQDFSYEEAA